MDDDYDARAERARQDQQRADRELWDAMDRQRAEVAAYRPSPSGPFTDGLARLIALAIPLVLLVPIAWFLGDWVVSNAAAVRATLATIYPDGWLFAEDGSPDAFRITIGVTTGVLVFGLLVARYFFLRAFTGRGCLTFLGALVISVVGVVVLLGGVVLMLQADVLAQPLAPDTPSQFIRPTGDQAWWPWLLSGLVILLAAFASTRRAVTRHLRRAFGDEQ